MQRKHCWGEPVCHRFQRLALLEGGSSDFCPPRVRTAGGLASRLRPPFDAAAAAAAAWPLVPLQEGNKERVSVRLSKVSCLVKKKKSVSLLIQELFMRSVAITSSHLLHVSAQSGAWCGRAPAGIQRRWISKKDSPKMFVMLTLELECEKQNKGTFVLKI